MYLILKSESQDQRELPFKHKVLDNTSKDFCTDALILTWTVHYVLFYLVL